MKKIVKLLLFSSFLVHSYLSYLYPAGISSPCGSMYLGNLKIGQTYSLQKLLGYPFSVTYKGRYMVDLNIALVKPSTTTSDGYEPIPDLNWIKIQKTEFSLDPGQTAETDILITIPDDEKYLGKKYKVDILPCTSAPKIPGVAGSGIVFSSALMCGLKLEIAGLPPTPEEIRLIKKQALSGELGVFVSPERIFLVEIPTGEKVDVKKKYNEVIKIINSTDEQVDVELESIEISKSGFGPPSGYIETENPNWLILKTKKFKLKPNTIKEIELFLNIPPDKKDKKYYFVVSCLVRSKHREIRNSVKIYAETQK